MQKNIKRLVIKHLKTRFPYRRRLTKKPKKALAVTFVHLAAVPIEIAMHHQGADKEHPPKPLRLAA